MISLGIYLLGMAISASLISNYIQTLSITEEITNKSKIKMSVLVALSWIGVIYLLCQKIWKD